MKKILIIISIYVFININIYSKIWNPYIGAFNGHYDLSVGMHVWSDKLDFRNLQLRTTFDILPGFRFNSLIRTNKEFNEIETFEPVFDEIYLERYFFNKFNENRLAFSLKIGNIRYLRFPEPDIISQFDQVPGTEDLRYESAKTGYKGILLTIEYNTKYNIGIHSTYLDNFNIKKEDNFIEKYIYLKKYFKYINFESRYGYMQLRHPVGKIIRGPSPYQLGASGKGYNVYLGSEYKGYRAGIFYENLYDKKYKVNDIRTGILVQFADSKVTQALGSVRFDYTRNPEGFGITIPILHGNIGNIQKDIPKNSKLVGEIYAYRTITYWQNGQGRNFYEHRINYWGDVESKDLIVVMEEKPWYLKIESLVSPHTEIKTKEDIVDWERDRQGPAELRQEVIYKFYKK